MDEAFFKKRMKRRWINSDRFNRDSVEIGIH